MIWLDGIYTLIIRSRKSLDEGYVGGRPTGYSWLGKGLPF
jgi:hypothetical protein